MSKRRERKKRKVIGKREREEKREEKGIRMCFWNVAGIINKDREVWDYLSGFEMVGLTETWMENEG